MLRWPYKWRKPEGVKKGIPKIRGLWYKWDCLMENVYIRLSFLPKEGLNKLKRAEKIVVSLTSFPSRIKKAYYAIKSLMLQSYKADRIVLWLADSQFPHRTLPKRFQKLITSGLEVRWCDDLRSHKKYFYILQEQRANEVVITYDDDIIYERDSIEKLVKMHQKYPTCIVCNRGHEMLRDSNGCLKPYAEWVIHSRLGVDSPARDILPSTGNGCLYPYHCMPDITFQWDIAQKNALTADDIWMRFCSLHNGVAVVKTKETIATLCNVMGSQQERLTQLNDLQGENQKVIDRLQLVFSTVYQKEEN